MTKNNDSRYWRAPPEILLPLHREFCFTHEADPYPWPEGYDPIEAEWGERVYLNPAFGGQFFYKGRYHGPAIWAGKAVKEARKGKQIVFVYPIDRWILSLVDAGADIRNLGKLDWSYVVNGKTKKSLGRGVGCFILGQNEKP